MSMHETKQIPPLETRSIPNVVAETFFVHERETKGTHLYVECDAFGEKLIHPYQMRVGNLYVKKPTLKEVATSKEGGSAGFPKYLRVTIQECVKGQE